MFNILWFSKLNRAQIILTQCDLDPNPPDDEACMASLVSFAGQAWDPKQNMHDSMGFLLSGSGLRDLE